MGRILNTHYNSKELAAELIDGGDMSCCWTEDRFSIDPTHGWKVQEYGPQYYAQRGDNCPPRLDIDLLGYLHPDKSEEYAYLFRNGQWVCYNMHQFDDTKLPEIIEIPSAALAV